MGRRPLWPQVFVCVALAISGLASARADEPVASFLEALRERRYFDEAMDYLDLLAANPQASESVRQQAHYEQGATLLAAAAGERDPQAHDTQLARAADLFAKFQQQFPQHALVASAKLQVANILVERGRGELHEARLPDQARKDVLLAASRKRFEEARAAFTAAEAELDGQLQKMPKFVGAEDKELKSSRRQLVADLAQSRLLRASVDYELAKTFDGPSAEAKKHFRAAVTAYSKLSDSYRASPAGLVARFWEGCCHQELGQLQQALGCYTELLDQPTTADTRLIKTRATRQALECWCSQKKYQEAIERGERWEKEADSGQVDAEAQAIRYFTALALQGQSDSLPAKDPNRKRLSGAARQTIVAVAKYPGEFQRPAKTMLVALAPAKEKDSKKGSANREAFVEKYEHGREALEKMQEATAVLTAAEQGADKAAIAEARKEKQKHIAEAQAALERALALSDAKTPIEDLNSVRYYLCFLAWDAGRYYDAAVLGEFLARNYPDTQAGRQGSRIALASFVRLYGDSKADDKSFETEQVRRIAELIFKKWPDQEESDDAALTLLNFAVAQHQLDQAMEYLNKISANSPRRVPAELRAGQAFWSAYLRGSQASGDARPAQEQLDDLKKRAQQVLAEGLVRMEKADTVDAALAGAAFTMAQICVEDGQADKAIGWLENPKFGPLTLIRAESPLAAREGFAAETYRTALRAYISADPPQVKKAEEVMDSLDKLVASSGDAKAADNLTAIYLSLGRELQKQMQALKAAGKRKEMDTIAQAFEVFLDRVIKRGTGVGNGSLNWVGETYYNLATGLDDAGPALAARSAGYFKKAAAAYQQVLESAEKDPKYRDQPDALTNTRLRLADCYRHAGNFDESIRLLRIVLHQRPTLLSAQVQGAETLQARGATDADSYVQAIAGGAAGRDGKNIIWGWNKLSKEAARAMAKDPKFADTFYQSRYNLANTRFCFALTIKDDAKRAKILDAAKQDLWYTYKLYPKLGGEESSTRFDALLKQIQKGLGNKQVGLAEFKDRDATSAAAK